MKKILLLIACFTAVNVQAQHYWNFETATVTSSNGESPNITVSPITLHNNNGSTELLVDGSSSGYDGASGGKAAAASAKEGGFDKNNSTYFEISLTPAPGNSIVLAGISFAAKSSGLGPTNWSVRTSNVSSSLGPYGEDFGAGGLNTDEWELESSAFSLVGAANEVITLRLYGFNFTAPPTAGEVNWMIDDLKIHTDIQTMPIKLKTFEAQSLIASIQLKWTTSLEENTKDFEILRSSDGKTFTTIGKVDAAGNSTTEKSYSFTDYSPSGGINYYQLLQRDHDGKYAKSKIVTASSAARPTDIRLSSVNGGVQLVIFSNTATKGQLILSNLSGQTIENKEVKLDKGKNTIILKGEYPSSVLIASLKTSSESISKKFLVR
ncbi:hypothetical protein [Desertivirga xinjiangensis]|uniref:hypothetical protein n=1 Tax=Desertivirga xinjiangensis TaxID=539206 RepID=UPI00210ED0B1|nr:hypothetical protein [Pedobacter xinjiangensis]